MCLDSEFERGSTIDNSYRNTSGHSASIDALLPRVSVIVPTLNEAANLPHVLPRIPHSVKEILVVDGHSSDDTATIALKYHPKVRVIYQKGKGKGDALRCGFGEARGDLIVTLDADGSMRPEEMLRFLEALANGYDFAKGTRFKGDGGSSDMEGHRVFGNRVFAMLTNLLYRSRYTDVTYGYNAFWKRCLDRVELRSAGFDIETETAIRFKKAKLKIIEIPSYEDARLNGKANLHSFRDGWHILKEILKELVKR